MSERIQEIATGGLMFEQTVDHRSHHALASTRLGARSLGLPLGIARSESLERSVSLWGLTTPGVQPISRHLVKPTKERVLPLAAHADRMGTFFRSEHRLQRQQPEARGFAPRFGLDSIWIDDPPSQHLTATTDPQDRSPTASPLQ